MTAGRKLRKPEPAEATLAHYQEVTRHAQSSSSLSYPRPPEAAVTVARTTAINSDDMGGDRARTDNMMDGEFGAPRDSRESPSHYGAQATWKAPTSGAYSRQHGSSHTTVYSPQLSPVTPSARTTSPIKSETGISGDWNVFEPHDGRKSSVQSQIPIGNDHRTSRSYDQLEGETQIQPIPRTYDDPVQPPSIHAPIPAMPSQEYPHHQSQSVALLGTSARLPQSEALRGTTSPPNISVDKTHENFGGDLPSRTSNNINGSRQNGRPLLSAEPTMQDTLSTAMEVDAGANGGRAVDSAPKYIEAVRVESQMSLDEDHKALQSGTSGIDVACQTEDRLSQRPPSYTTTNDLRRSQRNQSSGIGSDVDMDSSSTLHDFVETPPRTPVPNILVFGETGTGKSSLINMIAGSNIAGVSGEALGYTFDSIAYGVNVDGVPMTIWDTAGLNEGDNGTVTAQQAILNLHRLVKNLRNVGVHLLVYCIRGTRFRDVLRANYNIFHTGICQGTVPIVIVITGLEHEDPMEKWWEINMTEFAKHKMEFRGHACVTTSKGKKLRSGEGYMFEEEYAFSQGVVRELIKKHCSPTPVKMDELSMQTIANTLSGCYEDAKADVSRGGERAASGSTILRILEGLIRLVTLGLVETGQLVC